MDRLYLQSQQAALARTLTGYSSRNGHLMEDAVLDGLNCDELARSAEILIRKRLAQTRAALPGSSRTLERTFVSEFRIFSQNHFFQGIHAVQHEAIAFSRWLAERHSSPDWLQDVLRWECSRCCWESQRFFFAFLPMNYAIASWLESPSMREPARQRHWVWMWRVGARGRIRSIAGGFTFPSGSKE